MKKNTILRSAALIGAVVILGAAALSVGSADAARGGKSGGSQTAATLSVSPDPVAAYSVFHISGCGYVPGEGVGLNLWTDSSIASTGTTAGADGCISGDWSTNGSGTYTLVATTGRRHTVVASLTFQVY